MNGNSFTVDGCYEDGNDNDEDDLYDGLYDVHHDDDDDNNNDDNDDDDNDDNDDDD